MSQNIAHWIWYPGDFVLYHNMLLHSRREEYGHDYPCMWHVPRPEYSCRFVRRGLTVPHDTTLTVAVKGKGYFQINGVRHTIKENGTTELPISKGSCDILVILTNIDAFPALYVEGEGVATGPDWLVDRFSAKYYPAECEPLFALDDDPRVFPFCYRDLTPVSVEETDGGVLYDFGVESFGPIVISATAEMGELHVAWGESREEATDPDDAIVQKKFPARNGEIACTSRAFRYIYVKPANGGVPSVAAKLEYLPIEDIARFSCDDEKIAPIWEICTRTFHLNSREFYLDGIKRDRWCWSGDAYQSFMVNRYLYFEPAIIRRSIRALLGKQPYEMHVNTINDYSAYLIIAVLEYYRSTGDSAFVDSVACDLYALYRFIVSRLDGETGYVVRREGDWIFIDWADIDKDGPLCAEQILLWQVYNSMEALSAVSAEIPRGDYAARATALRASVLRDFWDEARGAFIDTYASGRGHITRHANIFAVLYDFADADMQERIHDCVLTGDLADPITTPYFKFFELMALGKLGDMETVQDFIDSYWGGMLDLGATSVWEQFDPRKEGRAHLEMYGDEYGCSLCHAWGSGPIALLGNYCAGVKLTDVAYRAFDVAPNPGKYKHFAAVVPVCGGSVSVTYKDDHVTARATVPGGTLYWNGKQATLPVNEAVTL